jgi:CBS domain containing-hemolysin-like protein
MTFTTDTIGGLIATAVLLFLNGTLAAARAGLVNASRGRLRQLMQDGVSGAALTVRVAEDATQLLATLRLAQTFCRFGAAGLVALIFTPLLRDTFLSWWPFPGQAGPLAFSVLIVAVTMLVISVGEFLPEALALRNAEESAVTFAPVVAVLEWLLGPLVRFLLWMSDAIARPVAGQRLPLVTEEEIKTLVDAGEEGGAIEEDEKEMIYSIFEISETWARELMVPRTDISGLDVNTSFTEAADMLLQTGHSRVPVYEDSIDTVIGILYAKDLLRLWHASGFGSEAPSTALRELLRPAYFIPETKKANDLLTELQARRIHMAIVVDEYGGTAGLVTLEDIVEEIVGDIRDEYDVNEEVYSERLGPNEFRFDARISLDEVNELLGTHLPNEEIDSLGGYVYGQLGHVPVTGETFEAEAVTFEVLQVTGRRIRKVRARLATPPDPDAQPDTRRDAADTGPWPTAE